MTLRHILFCLFFKSVESLQCILKCFYYQFYQNFPETCFLFCLSNYIKLLWTAAFNLSSKEIYLKAQLSLFVDRLAVSLWVYAPKGGCSNPHSFF